nr:hypothetical protein [Tanacetum cinerariifolium]
SARQAGYQRLLSYLDQHPVPTIFPAVVYAVAGAGSPTEDQIRRDAELAYAYALRWAATGEPAAAQQAIAILNGYARTFQRYDTAPKPDGSPTPFRQTYLEAAWVAPTFVAAAEILRYYQAAGKKTAGWPTADVARFSGFLAKLKTDYIDPLPAAADWVNNWQHREVWPGIEVAYGYYGTPALAALRTIGAPYSQHVDAVGVHQLQRFRPAKHREVAIDGGHQGHAIVLVVHKLRGGQVAGAAVFGGVNGGRSGAHHGLRYNQFLDGRAGGAARDLGPEGQERVIAGEHRGPIHGREAAHGGNGIEQVCGPVVPGVVGLRQQRADAIVGRVHGVAQGLHNGRAPSLGAGWHQQHQRAAAVG